MHKAIFPSDVYVPVQDIYKSLYRADSKSLVAVTREATASYFYDLAALLKLLKKIHDEDIPNVTLLIEQLKDAITVMQAIDSNVPYCSMTYRQLKCAVEVFSIFYNKVQLPVKAELKAMMIGSQDAHFMAETDVCHIQLLIEEATAYAKTIKASVQYISAGSEKAFTSLVDYNTDMAMRKIIVTLNEFLSIQQSTADELERTRQRIHGRERLVSQN